MRRLAVSFLLALWAVAAFAQPPRSVFLDDLTWIEVREATTAGKTLIIIPIGGTEQNGPHMALGKHNVRVKALAEKIAASLGNALVAPVIEYVPQGPISPPGGHMRFPGTITLPEDVFEKLLESAARGFRLHGFKDIIFIGDHGGYQKSIKKAADRLNREWSGTSVHAHAIEEYYRTIETGFTAMLTEKGFKSEEIGTHAGLADTSLMLAIDPALVRMDRLAAPNRGKADGVYGDPRRASAELGKAGVEMVVERTVDAIRKATAHR